MSDSTTNMDGFPDEDAVRKLPLLAQVAFAARCARRIQPLLLMRCPDLSERDAELLRRAVDMCEVISEQPDRYNAADGEKLIGITGSILDKFKANKNDNLLQYEIVNTIARAAKAAGDFVERGLLTASTEEILHGVYVPVARAARAAKYALGSFWTKEIEKDYQLLLNYTSSNFNWITSTPIPPEFFGPLWPEGKPDGWPEESIPEEEPVIKLAIAVPPKLTQSQSNEFNRRVADLLAEMSKQIATMGGTGLRIIDHQSLEPIAVDDESPEYCTPDGEAVRS